MSKPRNMNIHTQNKILTYIQSCINWLLDNKTTVIANPEGETTSDLTKVQIDDIIYDVGGSATASDVSYDNTTSGLSADDVQEAIDEVQSNVEGMIPLTQKGANGGVPELDSNGKVPSSQLPSYVDDVIEGYYNSNTDRFYKESTFITVIPPEGGKSWVDVTTNKSYRWTGSVYTRVDEGVQLGETSSTAYRGDRGKTAYEHSQMTSGNPHNVSKSDVGLGNVPNVSTNDQTPTFTQASTRVNIASGEKLSVILGKIMKWFTDLKTVAFSGSYNDLDNKPTIPTVNNGTLTIQKNGTNVATFTANQSGNATANIQCVDTVDSALSDSSTNPLQNKIVTSNIKAINTNGAKNLLPMNGTTDTVSGVTYTPQSDGTVIANGTSTGTSAWYILRSVSFPAGDYLLDGGGNLTSNGVRIVAAISSGGSVIYRETSTSSPVNMTIPSNSTVSIYLRTNGGNVSINNVKVYPMIRLAGDTDPTYHPYAKTNLELTNQMPTEVNYLARNNWWTSSSSHNVDDAPIGAIFVYIQHGAPVNGTLLTVAGIDTSGSDTVARNYRWQILTQYNNVDNVYVRCRNGDTGNWTEWRKLINANGGTITGNLTVSNYIYASFFNGNASVQDSLSGLSSYVMYCNSDGWFRKSSLDNMKYLLSQSLAAKIPQHSNNQAGWRRLCKIKSPNNSYSNGLLYISGDWSNTAPTMAIVCINTLHKEAKLTLISNNRVGGLTEQLRLVYAGSSGEFWVDAYLKGSNKAEGDQRFTFDGNLNITDIQNSAEIITDTVTAAATIDFTQKVISGLMVTSSNFDSYVTGSITSGNTKAVTGGAVYAYHNTTPLNPKTDLYLDKSGNIVEINSRGTGGADLIGYTIASGYRPKRTVGFSCYVIINGSYYSGQVTIRDTGVIEAYYFDNTVIKAVTSNSVWVYFNTTYII